MSIEDNHNSTKNYFARPAEWSSMMLFQKITYTLPLFTEAFAPYVDKLEAKRIAKDMAGDLLDIPQVIRILKDTDDITKDDMNSQHIIKATHASGHNIDIVANVNYNMHWIKQMLKRFNKSYHLHLNESQYMYVKPRFFIEEKIKCYTNNISGNAITFMIYCIYGKPLTVILTDRNLNRYRHFIINDDYTLEQIAIENQIFHDFIIPETKHMNKMFDIAKILSKPFEFVRVDFYLGADDKIYFSEWTFTPCAGEQIYSDALELSLGKLWL